MSAHVYDPDDCIAVVTILSSEWCVKESGTREEYARGSWTENCGS